MKRKFIVLATILVFLSTSSLSIFGQESVEKKSSAYRMNEMWYVSLGGGPNILMSNEDGKMPSFGDRFQYGGEVSVGKWFNPTFGTRAQFYLGKYRGFNYCKPQYGTFTSGDGKSYYPQGWPDKLSYTPDGSGFYQVFNSASAFLDFTVNITQLFRKQDSEPKHFDLMGYLGAGYLHNWETETNPTVNCFGGRFGGRLNYNPVKGGPWSIYLEGNGTFLPEKYDGYIGDEGYDSNANVLIGIQYTFKKIK